MSDSLLYGAALGVVAALFVRWLGLSRRIGGWGNVAVVVTFIAFYLLRVPFELQLLVVACASIVAWLWRRDRTQPA